MGNYILIKSLGLLSGMVLCATACSVSKMQKGNLPAVKPLAAKESNPPVYQPSRTKEWELVHTTLDLHFELPERRVKGLATLSMNPYFYDTDSVVLDAVGMQIASVKMLPGNTSLSYEYDQQQLKIRLPKKYNRKETLQIIIDYSAQPNTLIDKGTSSIRSDRGLFFINTGKEEPQKPIQFWTQGETQANSKWFPTFDSPNFKTTLDLTMHVPDSFKTLSNGLLKSAVKEANGMRADRWVQDLPFAPYLAMMAAGDFAVVKEQWHGKEVSYYVPPKYAGTAKQIFNHTPEMMNFFSERLGVPYPWEKYSQVAVYNFVSGAMENVTASVFGSFNLKNERELADANNDYIVAHELFHQWFGDYVTCESWGNLTVNESFADYSEFLWSEYKYGPNAAEEVWQNALTRYLQQAEKNDPSLVRCVYSSAGEMFDRVSYNKGGRTLHYLRSLMGDDAFFAGLKEYLTQHKLGTAEATDLRLAFEKVTGKDWNWFFNQWYYKGGHPKLNIQYTYDDAAQQLKVTVKQLQSDSVGLYDLPLKAQLLGKDDKVIDWHVKAQKEQVFVYPYQNGKAPVFVPDALHWLPGELKVPEQSVAEVSVILRQTGSFISKRNAISTLFTKKNTSLGTARHEAILLALQDTIAAVRTFTLQQLNLTEKGLPKTIENKVHALAANDPNTKVQAAAILVLSAVDNSAYSSLYEQALESKSYMVAANALIAIYRNNRKLGYDRASEFKTKDPKANLLNTVFMILAQNANAADYDYLVKQINDNYDGIRTGFINQFAEYLIHTEDLNSYNKGIAFLKKIATVNEGANQKTITELLAALNKEMDKILTINKDKAQVNLAKEKKNTLSAQ
ncbi:M1 family metallopeptidase [Taibaiella sp. KBW10]|uniref:M1 family metallopeptidase n=1 Tax=Taibaiella sp. KBW10 TaxID=2153357 RepID=UPI0013150D57|nr:M1 family metallopeptidase [Taibaiella sp. KBW10]